MDDNQEAASGWVKELSEEQQEKLQWLVTHRCTVEVRQAGPDLLHDLPAGVVMEVVVDKHAVVKLRATSILAVFDHAFNAARQLFDFVESYDPTWRGASGDSAEGDEPNG